MTDELKKGLTAIFSGISEGINREAEQHPLFLELMKQEGDFEKAETFHLFHVYPLFKAIGRAVEVKKNLTRENAEVVKCIFVQHSFFHWHLRNLFVELEGSACCADKSRTVLQRYVKYKITGEMFEWDNTNPKNFGLPKTGTQEDWYEFIECLCDLFYGNPKKYLVKLKYFYDLAAKRKVENE